MLAMLRESSVSVSIVVSKCFSVFSRRVSDSVASMRAFRSKVRHSFISDSSSVSLVACADLRVLVRECVEPVALSPRSRSMTEKLGDFPSFCFACCMRLPAVLRFRPLLASSSWNCCGFFTNDGQGFCFCPPFDGEEVEDGEFPVSEAEFLTDSGALLQMSADDNCAM